MWLKMIALVGLTFIVASPALAVMLGPGKQGQVLIFPYYGTFGGNNTAISISSKSPSPKALKVHFRNIHGETTLSFNLYLESHGSWVGALTRANDETYLHLPDSSCIFPSLDDGSGTALVPLTSGYLEVIEMGVITDGGVGDLINEFDCDGLGALWSENGQWFGDPSFGLGSPDGELSGLAMLTNVEHGTMYSFVATALTDFSDIQQHTSPVESLPDLASAHDAGTDEGFTTSVVCTVGVGGCIEDTWEAPVYAVAAVLSARELSGDFNMEPDIGAITEVIMTAPLAQYYEPDINYNLPPIATYQFIDRQGLVTGCTDTCEEEPMTRDFETPGITILSTNYPSDDLESEMSSSILWEESAQKFPNEGYPQLPINGALLMRMESPIPQFPVVTGRIYRPIWDRTSLSGKVYQGSPVIGFVLQQFTNGHLTNEQGQLIQANYGNAFELSRKMGILE